MDNMNHISINNVKIQKNGKSLSFDINNIDVAFVNALRRIILADIPNIAVAFNPSSSDPNESDIIFHKNTSALHNEFIGHRISLLPLYLSKDEIESFDHNDFKCYIKKKNNTLQLIEITTDDIILKSNKYKKELVFPHDDITKDPILITKLRPNINDKENGEEIDIEFTARKGHARMHARWCPVSLCTYFNVLDTDLILKLRKQYDKDNLHLFDTLEKYRMFKKNKYGEANCFHFSIDSECRLKSKEIINMAFNELEKKLDLFNSKEKYKIDTIDSNDLLYHITIINEDHTLGNLLQTYIYNNHVRENKDILFVGYYQPHPLENQIIMKLKGKNKFNCDNFFTTCITNLKKELGELKVLFDREIKD